MHLVTVALSCAVLGCAFAQYDYEEALRKSVWFYEAQRSGYLPPDNRVSWRGDSATDDGQADGVDLEGGWYDAGDHLKFGFPLASSVTLLAWGADVYKSAYQKAGEWDHMLDSLRWALDYMKKCHLGSGSNIRLYGQVAHGQTDHDYWGRPEDMTMDRPSYYISPEAPGSDLAAETAAAFAASYLVFRDEDSDYAEDLRARAMDLYDFAYNYRGLYHHSITDATDYYGSYDYNDELGWGAIWLYRATGDSLYLNYADEFYSGHAAWSVSWDDKTAGTQLLNYVERGDDRYRQDLEGFLVSWFPGGSVTYTPQGLAWRDAWGCLRYSANVAFIAFMAADAGIMVDESRDFAKTQIDYMLGSTGRSYVVGFGVNPPERPHHRAASCPADHNEPCDHSYLYTDDPNPSVLHGALVGGPTEQDQFIDNRENYQSNEVTIDYNAGFQGALAGFIDYLDRST